VRPSLLAALLIHCVGCGRSPVAILGSGGGADGGADEGLDEGADDDPCPGGTCSDACAEWSAAPTSAGCSFVLVQHAGVNEEISDALVVANPHEERSATVQLSWIPTDSQGPEAVGSPVTLGPGQTQIFELPVAPMIGDGSQRRVGGVFRLDSDAPVAGYQHSPGSATAGNDSLLLLPVEALGRDYIVQSYPARGSLEPFGEPSYFDVIALEDDTRVEWIPLYTVTQGDGASIPQVDPGETGSVVLQRHEVLRVVAASIEALIDHDVSGTRIEASVPIAVVSGCRCAQVPMVVNDAPFAGCDPVLEQLLPLEHWGDAYVAARAPMRGNELHYWRIYAGADFVTVTSQPYVLGLAHLFVEAGEYVDVVVPDGLGFTLEGDGPFLPVQLLQSAYLPEFDLSYGTSRGDPSMLQAVPTDRWLRRYVIATPKGFDFDVVQLVRRIAGAEVLLDGVVVSGWSAIDGTFELADVTVSSGAHVAASADPFGLVQVGYTEDDWNEACAANTQADVCFSSYAYAGGLALVPE